MKHNHLFLRTAAFAVAVLMLFAAAVAEEVTTTEPIINTLLETTETAAVAEPEPEAASETEPAAQPEAGLIEVSTQYPALTAKAGDSLTFKLDLENQSGASQDLALSIEELPEGWTGSFSASSKQVSIVHVKHEEVNDDISFALDIPLDAEDGVYTICLKAGNDACVDTMNLYLTVDAEEIGESSFTPLRPARPAAGRSASCPPAKAPR